MMSDLNEWDAVEAVEVSTQELDAKITELQDLWAEYERLKAIASEQHERYENAERYVMGLMKAARKTSYIVDGLGTASIRTRYVVRTPKTLTDKRLLFDWIQEKHGEETLAGMLSINHQTLNSFVNAEKENDSLVQIAGLEAPTAEESLAFRAKKK